MRTKTLRLIGFTLVALFIVGLVATLAQEATNVVLPPEPPDVSNAPLPKSTFEFWTYGIAIIVPLLVGLMKKLIPKIPTWVLPVSTPFVGVALGAILHWLGVANLSWVDMGQAGAMASMVRESWNQLVTKPIKGEEGAKTKETI